MFYMHNNTMQHRKTGTYCTIQSFTDNVRRHGSNIIMYTRTRAKVRRCVCAYCGEHNTSVTGPDHPVQHTYRRCPTTTVPSACARAMEILCRGRVLPSLLHGSQTQVSRVSFMPVDPTSYSILPIYCVYT